jgi:hypothetical protein
MGQQLLVEIMGNKGKEKDLHIPRKMHILLNLAQRKHHVKEPSRRRKHSGRKGHLNLPVLRNSYSCHCGLAKKSK